MLIVSTPGKSRHFLSIGNQEQVLQNIFLLLKKCQGSNCFVRHRHHTFAVSQCEALVVTELRSHGACVSMILSSATWSVDVVTGVAIVGLCDVTGVVNVGFPDDVTSEGAATDLCGVTRLAIADVFVTSLN